jgi:hypothetical protein
MCIINYADNASTVNVSNAAASPNVPDYHRVSAGCIPRMRHLLPYERGVIGFTHRCLASLVDEPCDQVGKLQKVRHPYECTPSPDNDLWIGRDEVGPTRRHRANPILIDAQQEPHPVRAVSLADADEASPAQRMEWVRDTYKMLLRVRTACTLC